ncbi:MAG: carboxypeptidase regulatory-like domain-containing protein [Bryobacteraceae bacterium]
MSSETNTGRRSLVLATIAALSVGLLACVQICAQGSAAAMLSGTISTPSGSRIPNAKVSLTNTANGEVKSVKANRSGWYSVAHVLPGKYDITASAPGFLDTRIEISIGAGLRQEANVQMQIVSAKPGSPTVHENANSTQIRELPLNGRSASDVVTLEPGIATARTQPSGQGQRGFGTQVTVSGIRPRQNDSRMNGISVNDYTNGPPGSARGVSLGVDTVEQFSVLTSNYPAQYGRSSGGIISSVTRSGTNNFHGSAFDFLRNSALDARNFFDAQKPPFRRNQFGASAGGALWKNRTHFFVDYEGVQQSLGITQVDTVPSAAARVGDLSSGRLMVNPNVLRFLNAFYPLPNGPLLGSGDTGLFSFAGQEVTPENYVATKVDRIFSSRDRLSGTYLFDTGAVQQPDELNNKRTGYESRRAVFTLDETRTFSPEVLNSARFGINRVITTTGLTFLTGNPFANDASFGTVPEHHAAGVAVPGLTTFSGGLGGLSSYHFRWTSIQGYDDVVVTRGKHSLKLGMNLERMRDNILGISNPTGQFTFNSLSDFLANRPFSLNAAIPSAVSERGFRQTILGMYLQDHWLLRPNFTIDIGLRYEMASVPTEVHGHLTALRHLADAQPHIGSPLFANSTLLNFEPRVGFSWDPFSDGKTAVSSGFGIFDVLPLPYEIQTNELFSAPFFQSGTATTLPFGSFPNDAFAAISASPSALRQAYFEPNPSRNYVMQWNFTIQRELAKNFSANFAYVGSRSVHNPFRVEGTDIVLPTLTAQGYLWPSPVGSGRRLNPNAGRISSLFWDSDGYYDGLQIQIKKIIGHGSLQGSYTFGKAIDTSSGSLVGDEYSNSIASPLWFNTKLNRGLADFNVAHNLEVNYTYEIGTPRWARGAGAWIASGWQVGGVFEASTGVPFTAGIQGDALGVKSFDPNIDLPNPILGPGCQSLTNAGNPVHYINTQCFAVPNPITLRGDLGRNTLIGPGLLNFDFSLFKNNHVERISKTFNTQFRAEFFNIVNHTNFAPPLSNKNVFDSSGRPIANAGLITATQTSSRQIQLAMKVIW